MLSFSRHYTAVKSADMDNDETGQVVVALSEMDHEEGSAIANGNDAIRADRDDTTPNQSNKPNSDEALQLIYALDDIPPWYACLMFGFQQQMTMIGGVITMPFLVAEMICIADDATITGRLFSTMLLMISLATFLQTTFGVRLPILQGPSAGFYFPALVFLSMPKWRCPQDSDLNGNFSINGSEYFDVGWKVRMREVQGAIIVSSTFEFLLGLSGIIGLLLRFIGPLTVAPIIVMIGLGIHDVASYFASQHWGIAFLTFSLIVLFSQYLRKVPIPMPVWTRRKGFRFEWIQLFNLFPVIIAIGLSWFICYIFTACDVFPKGSSARTDLRSVAVINAPWVTFPLPGQWGPPRVSIALVFGLLSGIIASAVESVGDYYACARLSGASPPPSHAVNRGICIEGLCCILSGIWGSGLGTTSFSENIGAIAITKVGSRRVMQWTSLLLFVSAVFGKFGAALATLPLPIVGGALTAIFSIILAAGASNLQFVNMNSSRSLCVFGTAVFCGVMIPNWVKENEGVIKTGSEEADQVLEVLLKTGMFVAGLIGFFLDNTIPGTAAERGLVTWHAGDSSDERHSYDLPWCLMKIPRYKWSRYVPFCPGFMEKRKSDQQSSAEEPSAEEQQPSAEQQIQNSMTIVT